MPGLFKISFAHSAISDLEDIIEFYKEHKVPHVGQRLVRNVFKEVELLSEQPDIGRIVPEFDLNYLRELIRPPLRIVYRRDIDNARIIRVWRSERLLILP